jgi:hypothetical protein
MAVAFAYEPCEQNGVFGGIVSIITTVVSPQPVDFELDRKGFDSIDSGGQNLLVGVVADRRARPPAVRAATVKSGGAIKLFSKCETWMPGQ